jgi:hypothetical protein
VEGSEKRRKKEGIRKYAWDEGRRRETIEGAPFV